MAQTPSSRYVALNSADALRTSGSVAPTGLPRDSIPQIRRAPFGKMARTFLRHIRVQSLDELKTRILKGVAEINAAPVVHRWKNFKALEEK